MKTKPFDKKLGGRKPILLLTTSFVLFFTVFFGCRNDLSFLHSENVNYAVEISYEEETIFFSEFPGAGDISTLPAAQQVASVPVVSRTRTHLGIFEDGTVNMEITKLKPKNPFEVKSDALPDPTPQVAVTKITGGVANDFDVNGNLLNSTQITMPSYIDLIKAIKKNNNKFNNDIYNQYIGKTNLKSASDNGVTTAINDTLQSIKKPITAADGFPVDLIGKTSETVIDTRNNTAIGFAILDSTDNFFYRKYIRYNTSEGLNFPAYSKTENFRKTQEGIDYVIVSITETDNFLLTNNLD